MKGKEKNELRERYKQLMAKNGGGTAPAAASPTSESSSGTAVGGGGRSGGGKKEKGQGGKGKAKEEAAGVKEQGMRMEAGEGRLLYQRPLVYVDENDDLSLDEVCLVAILI